jgi:cell division protein ZapE
VSACDRACRAQVRRFITLIDCLYDARTRVVLLSEAEPTGIFDSKKLQESGAPQDEVFAFDRTVSRLMEMQGKDYIERSVRLSQLR